MKIITRGRGQGKTTELIKMAAENHYYIICASMERVRWVAEQARNLGLDIPFPLTYTEFIRREYYAKGCRGFLVDDADQLIQYMSSVPVFAISITKDDENDK